MRAVITTPSTLFASPVRMSSQFDLKIYTGICTKKKIENFDYRFESWINTERSENFQYFSNWDITWITSYHEPVKPIAAYHYSARVGIVLVASWLPIGHSAKQSRMGGEGGWRGSSPISSVCFTSAEALKHGTVHDPTDAILTMGCVDGNSFWRHVQPSSSGALRLFASFLLWSSERHIR